jgi:hypothetical protein
MAKQTKTAQFSVVKGLIEDEIREEDANGQYQTDVLAHMDARTDLSADEWTKELNGIETDLDVLAVNKRTLEAKKEAISRLISRYMQANNLTSFVMNGFTYGEEFKPVAKVSDKHALVDHVLKTGRKDLLSVHSGTLNSWVSESILKAIEAMQIAPISDELAALGVTADDTRGKESLGTEGGREAFMLMLDKVIPPGVVATARTKLSRRKK